MTRFWLLVFMMLYGGAARAQEKVLLVLEPGVMPSTVAERAGIHPRHFSVVDADFRLYSVRCAEGHSPEKLLYLLRRTRGVAMAQQSMPVMRRRTPDDPLYSRQRFLSTMSAPGVWDKITGGLNRAGDTLVVAFIDDGMDTAHPDLLPNMWFNRHEIPFNGIDDDGNGYVDDYRGWNGGDSNSTTFTTQSLVAHGTGIAGVMGARGNNGRGISGINWQIKLMPLVCYPLNGVDADLGVIRSMLYALRMKRLYMQTAGAKGAMIMAINTSVGIDRAFPADQPIWCALYDSLGHAGIFSSLATSNTNTDVGVAGDIPSLCPSPFTLVVNNTDADDNRINSGFSSVHVDLAAPGQSVLTTALNTFGGPNGPYNEQSGTSFAAPMVGAAAALLASGACDSFWTLHARKPDSAVRLLRTWIMTGTKRLSVLDGKCVSGGRLDLQGAWQQMDNWCRTVQPGLSVTRFFPNPARPGDVLTCATLVDAGTRYEIYSHDGRLMQQSECINRGQLKLPGLKAGVYFIRLNSHQGTIVARILVEI